MSVSTVKILGATIHGSHEAMEKTCGVAAPLQHPLVLPSTDAIMGTIRPRDAAPVSALELGINGDSNAHSPGMIRRRHQIAERQTHPITTTIFSSGPTHTVP